MSGKYTSKQSKRNTGRNRRILLALAVLSVLLIGLLLFVFWMEKDTAVTNNEKSQEDVLEITTEPVQPDITISHDVDVSESIEAQEIFDLGSGLKITGIFSYTGAFMEDRTDGVVTDVLAIQVANSGEEYIQTMDITLISGETEAQFSLSTLFPGETVVVLEKNRMAYSTAPEFEQAQTSAVVLFDEHPGMCQDILEIQCLNGVINVTNVSGKDISGDILVYYKNYVSGIYYGGITYRIRIEGGLKADEIKQGTAAHFNPDNSTVVFVTCG